MIDYFFTIGTVYKVTDIKMDFGVSDHAALSGVIHIK